MAAGGVTEYLDFEADWTPDAIAAYDELPLWSAMAGLLLFEHLPMRPGIRALDVGFGTGFPLFELAQRLGPTSTVVGLDPWLAPLDRVRLKHRMWSVGNARVVRGDAAAMPFESAQFDLVVSNLGLNNFDDAPVAVRECGRVLRPDGRLAMTTNLVGHMGEFYEVFDATLREMGLPDALPALQRHIEHRATVPRVRTLFEDAGLRVTRVEERPMPMRFASGSAFLRHHLIKVGFLAAWKGVVPEADRVRTFDRLEANLNVVAAREGELRLTVPLAYIEAARV